MPTTTANGIEICYETFGDASRPPLLFVMGFTAQMVAWDEAFMQMFADRGFFVIRYDNRDCGLSTRFDGVATSPAPYSLADMAADGIGLLDQLGIAKAHIVGASMGGMIVQTMAINHPDRVLTLTSIMSTTGEPDVGQATPEAIGALLKPPPADRDSFIAQSVETGRVFSSPRYFDAEMSSARAARSYDRAYYPEGSTRQLAAIMAGPPRNEALGKLSVPTLVIHGRADTLIQPSGGERTAAVIPGANLLMMNDMGHDLPRPLWPLFVDAIVSHCTHAIG